jgi:hypothetical protein
MSDRQQSLSHSGCEDRSCQHVHLVSHTVERRSVQKIEATSTTTVGMSSLHFPFTSMTGNSVPAASPNTSSTLQYGSTVLHHQSRSSLLHHHLLSHSTTFTLSADEIARIISALLFCCVYLQLWVGQSAYNIPHRCGSPANVTFWFIMAIADVLFLPWPSWAKLGFVGLNTR